MSDVIYDTQPLECHEAARFLFQWRAPSPWTRRVLADLERSAIVVLLIHPMNGVVTAEFGSMTSKRDILDRLDHAVSTLQTVSDDPNGKNVTHYAPLPRKDTIDRN